MARKRFDPRRERHYILPAQSRQKSGRRSVGTLHPALFIARIRSLGCPIENVVPVRQRSHRTDTSRTESGSLRSVKIVIVPSFARAPSQAERHRALIPTPHVSIVPRLPLFWVFQCSDAFSRLHRIAQIFGDFCRDLERLIDTSLKALRAATSAIEEFKPLFQSFCFIHGSNRPLWTIYLANLFAVHSGQKSLPPSPGNAPSVPTPTVHPIDSAYLRAELPPIFPNVPSGWPAGLPGGTRSTTAPHPSHFT